MIVCDWLVTFWLASMNNDYIYDMTFPNKTNNKDGSIASGAAGNLNGQLANNGSAKDVISLKEGNEADLTDGPQAAGAAISAPPTKIFVRTDTSVSAHQVEMGTANSLLLNGK